MLIEYLLNHKPKPCPRLARDIIMISLISPLGLLSYMYFLLKNTSDPLIFVHEISIFGNQRSSRLVILPQVIYRYLFKILPTISNSSPPLIFTSYLEFATGIIFLAAIIYGFFRLKISYSIYSLIAYIIPTLSGSFSSFPRYALELFPCFVLFALILGKFQNLHKYLIISALITTLAVSTALFWRGYWIS
jgi:hypothetical protein